MIEGSADFWRNRIRMIDLWLSRTDDKRVADRLEPARSEAVRQLSLIERQAS